MIDTDNKIKQPTISKKWLYGSLAIAALLIGLFLDNDAFAHQNNSASNAIEEVKIDNEDDNAESDTDMDNDNFESYEDDFIEDDFTEDDFLEEDSYKKNSEL